MLFYVYCLLCVCASFGKSVTQLSDVDFDDKVAKGTWMIKFYAPWCGHCKSLAPTFDELAKSASNQIGKVDCTKNKQTCSRFGVRGYPTLKVIENGKSYDYSGKRDLNTLKAFVDGAYKNVDGVKMMSLEEKVAMDKVEKEEQRLAAENSKVVSLSAESFETEVVNGKDAWLLKFYAPWCGHCKRLAPVWQSLSTKLHDKKSDTKVGKIDCTKHRRVCSRFDVKGYPTLQYVRNGQHYKYQGGRKVEDFENFVNGDWKQAQALGAIPNEGFASSIVDVILDWAAANTVLAAIALILALALSVAILVALLDCCIGSSDEDEIKNRKQVDGVNKTE